MDLDTKIQESFDICDDEDRSTEYMLQFAQDYADCGFDRVMDYIERTWKPKEKQND
jgi:hypothetical protein